MVARSSDGPPLSAPAGNRGPSSPAMTAGMARRMGIDVGNASTISGSPRELGEAAACERPSLAHEHPLVGLAFPVEHPAMPAGRSRQEA
jgi:hypothetical protein